MKGLTNRSTWPTRLGVGQRANNPIPCKTAHITETAALCATEREEDREGEGEPYQRSLLCRRCLVSSHNLLVRGGRLRDELIERLRRKEAVEG